MSDQPALAAQRALTGITVAREAVIDLRLHLAIMRDSMLSPAEQVARIEAQMWWEARSA